MATETLNDLISRAVIREPFLGAVLAGLKREVDTNPAVGTMAVDGQKLYVSSAWLDTLTNEEVVFWLLHEAAHAALLHPWRCKDRHQKVFNIAADAVVNLLLSRSGHRPPKDAILIDWVTTDMDVETVYHKLMQKGEAQARAAGGGMLPDDVLPAPPEAAQSEAAAQMTALAKMAKAAGRGSLLIDRVVEEAAVTPVDWVEVLRHLLRESARDDYTYARFSRRFLHRRVYLPSLHTEAMGALVVAVDTSGSMGAEELGLAARNIRAIAEDCRPSAIHVVYCDSRVTHTETFEPGDEIALHPRGGGGTAFAPVFEWVEELGEKIAALIYLTDLYGNTDIEEPEYAVVWAVPNNRVGPFGTTVRIV